MSEIILFILTVILVIFAYKVVRSVTKRIFLVTKLKELKKTSDAKIKYHTLPFFSLLRFSEKPEITVEIGNRVYLIRLIGASSKHRRVHFASPEYTVTTKGRRFTSGVRMVYAGRATIRRRAVKVQAQSLPQKIGKVRLLPKLKIQNEEQLRGKTAVPVLIFNPAPHDVTYVTPEKNRVLAAFTGDKVYDHTIFTASTFVIYAERYEREMKERKKSASSFWDEYYS